MTLFPKKNASAFLILALALSLTAVSTVHDAYAQNATGQLRRTLWIPQIYALAFGSTGQANSPELARSAASELSLTGGSLRLGPARDLILEGATDNGFETTLTTQDAAADTTVTLPVGVNAVVGVGYTIDILLCGEMGNATAHYTSPATGYSGGAFYADSATVLYDIGGAGCNAQDSTTEATADEIMFADNAFKVLGFYCTVSSSGAGAGVTINLRSAAADLTPDVTMTIATGDTTGASVIATTTDIAAGATFALKTVSANDLSAQDEWCIAKIMLVP